MHFRFYIKMIGYFLKMKLKSIFYRFFVIFIISSIIYKFYVYKLTNSNVIRVPTILWWTPFYNNNLTKYIDCNINKCLLTENRSLLSDKIVYLFYGSNFKTHDLPLPRKKSDLWAIIHEESPKNLALFLYEDTHKLFNFSSTFSRHSNFPITLQYLPDINILTSTKYFIPVEEKNNLLNELSPILYIQSDCVTPLERDSYVNELMKYITIDSYGKCLNNKKLPEKLLDNPLNNLYSEDFLNFVGQYKFVISFENAICEDYITEKLWRPLIVGSVPIYIGSPSIKDWTPNNNSVIIANEFDSPKKLAEYLLLVNENDELYNKYLDHKILQKIENKFLTKTIQNRKWTIDNFDETHFFEAFECFICDNIDTILPQKNIYNCPMPISPITGKKNDSNWWISHWNEGKCQSKVLSNLVNNLEANLSKELFEKKVQQLIINNDC